MSRVVLLDMSAQAATDECHKQNIGVSALEALPAGGVRLVTMRSAPAFASVRAKRSPSPRLAPVTRAVRPVRSNMGTD